jgi:predicted regulator of Ras-like GTPase activity (Roadblock/LC7/MglB family)
MRSRDSPKVGIVVAARFVLAHDRDLLTAIAASLLSEATGLGE